MLEDWNKRPLEPEIAASLARHEDCDCQLGEEAEFWRDFSGRLRDALSLASRNFWRDVYPFTSPTAKRQRQGRYWLGKAIQHANPIASQHGFDIAPLLWLERFIHGDTHYDPAQAQAVQDLVAAVTLLLRFPLLKKKLGEHIPPPLEPE